MRRLIRSAVCVAVLWPAAVAARGGPADDAARRAAEAQKRVEERQKRIDSAAAAKAASRPATAARPATGPATQPAAAKKSDRVVFVLANRGSMIAQLDLAKAQVASSIEALRPDQSFNIVTAAEGAAHTFQKALVPATDANKKVAAEFLGKVEAHGTDGTLAGLDAAAKLRPDVVWLLCNADAKDERACLDLARRVSGPGRLRINTTLGCLGRDEDDQERVEFLEKMASLTGGVCLDKDGKPVKPKPPPKPVPPPPAPEPPPKIVAPPLKE